MTGTLARDAVDAVDVVLAELFEDRVRRAARHGEQYALLWRRLARSAEGGKRLRPRLLLDTHRAFGDPHPQDAAVAGAAFELLHTALLLHDDVLDQDRSRRGRLNLTGEFTQDAQAADLPPRTADAWGEASGILGGDLLLSAAHALLARVRPAAYEALSALVDECLFRAAAGEHADVAFALGTVPATPEGLVRMMEDKTGGYSFAAPLRAGAALADAGGRVDADLERVGTALGVLYQLRDDLLGVFGDAHRTGKSTTGDLREGKRTLLVTFAEGHPAWTAVRHRWGAPDLDADDADALRAALVASGARDATERLVESRRREVVDLIGGTALPTALRHHLTDLADRIVDRDS
ncbi:polyprenyl synthetase family protein [Promicromonospora sp. NPDC050880]|uniref:polyprenyl synthetase family protein n=1 Tax=Promicromonospora sp. NPDC050880 TaxID=3364406 RepID=UPI0037B75224